MAEPVVSLCACPLWRAQTFPTTYANEKSKSKIRSGETGYERGVIGASKKISAANVFDDFLSLEALPLN
jgi:hypothetical protein